MVRTPVLTSPVNQYNIRVYGILLWHGYVLISHEIYRGINMTKFPGGGHEFGEGLADTVIREFNEETGLKVSVLEHFYTTEFFIASAFAPSEQLISVYYKVKLINEPENYKQTGLSSMVFPETLNAEHRLEWVPVSKLDPIIFTFDVDKKVAAQLSFNLRK